MDYLRRKNNEKERREERRRKNNERKSRQRANPEQREREKEADRERKKFFRKDKSQQAKEASAQNRRNHHNANREREEMSKLGELSLNMMETPKPKQLLNHDTMPSIITSKLLFWQLSGRGQFRDSRWLPDLWNSNENERNSKERIHSLSQEIDEERIEFQDYQRILTQFNESLDPVRPIFGCGACGIRSLTDDFQRYQV